MITLDSRVGSKDLLTLFPLGSAELGYLEFGDCAFTGKGEKAEIPLSIGIERKKLPDLIDCMCTGRLTGHQLPGMHNCYHYCYLVVEGVWKGDIGGLLLHLEKGQWVPVTVNKNQYMIASIYKFLHSIEVINDVHVIRTISAQDTVTWIMSIYHWWNDKNFYTHCSQQKPYTPAINLLNMQTKSAVYRVAASLPGIGMGKAAKVQKHFPTVLAMVNATEREWGMIPGIGKETIKRVMQVIRKVENRKEGENEK